MSAFPVVRAPVMRYTVLAAVAGLIGLAGCGSTTVNPPGAAQSPSPATTAPSATATPGPVAPPAGEPGAEPGDSPLWSPLPRLTSVTTGQHGGYDRVVFQFSGKVPAHTVERVTAVYHDPKGDQVPLAGQSYLRVIFHGTAAVSQQPLRQAYTGPSVFTPYYPRLLTVANAGDFEGVLSFGLGLAAPGGYHAFTLTRPDRLVIDVSHVGLGKFPGIWNITTWPKYWAMQYSWLNGHQPWLSSPSMVVEAWARSQYGAAPVIRQVTANTFAVTAPSGNTVTVTGIRPVSVPGPWVITKIS